VIEEDPPFFNPAVSSGISSFREGPESMSPKLLRHCGGRPCRLREIKAGKCASAQGLVA
jgi:hypothetical protein